MCIICAKPANIAMPSSKTIENMWYRNPDGAGIMLYDKANKRVHIEKGFMSLEAFENALDRLSREFDMQSIAVVMHFRITTHGGTVPANTHPFPISDNVGVLKKLVMNTKIGVAHNGIIDIRPRSKDISDTMEYIASQLAPLSRFCPQFYKNKDAMQMINNAIGSKMAFLVDNNIYTIGKFEKADGILYSNTSYLNYSYYRGGTYGAYGAWDDSYWDDGYGNWVWNKDKKEYEYIATSDPDDGAYTPVEVHDLMDLYPYGGYITDGKALDSSFDYYADRLGRAWAYSAETDACFLITDAYACDEYGVAIPFVKEDAAPMACYPERYGFPLFTEEPNKA